MLGVKRALVIFLVITLALFVFGCRENPSATVEEQLPEEASPNEVETAAAQDFDVFVPDGKTDRLPGSLKWGSVTVYTAGIDFIRDQSDGLLTNAVSTQTTVTSTSKTVETTATTEGNEQAGQSGGGSYTSTYTGGGGSVSTNVTVDGSMSVTESTTINNGGSSGSSGTNWWEE